MYLHITIFQNTQKNSLFLEIILANEKLSWVKYLPKCRKWFKIKW